MKTKTSPMVVALATFTLGAVPSARAQVTPIQVVTSCGQVLSTPGLYVLAWDLGPCPDDGVSVTASDVELDLAGFQISGSCKSGGPWRNGVYVMGGASRVSIHGGRISEFAVGIGAYHAPEGRISAMELRNNCGPAIEVGNSRAFEIVANNVTDNHAGLVTWESDALQIRSNHVARNRYGLVLAQGVTLAIVERNTANDHQGAGIEIHAGAIENRIVHNSASRNGLGFRVIGDANQLLDNLASGNRGGIQIHAPGGHTRIQVNTAIGNTWFDLLDENAACGTNQWARNTFLVDYVAGVRDGGPATGCIR